MRVQIFRHFYDIPDSCWRTSCVLAFDTHPQMTVQNIIVQANAKIHAYRWTDTDNFLHKPVYHLTTADGREVWKFGYSPVPSYPATQRYSVWFNRNETEVSK